MRRTYTLIAGDFVDTGGMDRANLALALWLAKQGHPVRLVAHRVAEVLLRHPNVRFVRVPKPANAYLLGEPLLSAVGRAWALRTRAEGGRVVANGGNCPVASANWVHYVHGAYPSEPTGGVLRQLKGHVSHRYYVRSERQALRRARVIIANSERTRDDVVAATGVSASRVRVIYLGGDAERFRPVTAEARREVRASLGWPESRPVALFVGALGDRRKGFDTLFQAWARLCARADWGVDLKVVGSGAQRDAWEREAADRGLGQRIQFLGFRDDVARLLSAADVLVSPTRYDAYGLNVHEALCAGLPALVSRSAGVAERYPEALSGLLLDAPGDVDALVRRLEDWREHAAAWAPHVAALSETLRAQTWDTMAEAIVDTVEREG
ncbi:glycosyltransferase family 4 protein [Myxococcus xanthus]|uniref:Glycosyl transferase family 1 n=1 Tax=Myxococcus xanthus TaxID=34 RepID=A0AAE6FWF5_MYXXA|nr:glycosyltransferase family 4 protein [Myxococcus xanthus]QDE66468.1 glycosyl transferase family 1 [Myxococcus xanthus]QDE73741.1 glycosyl transferase family 1 [Myxococcus xanthus]QDE95333.1 glycosyl transferase family 1 [Myxococcus xanthus]